VPHTFETASSGRAKCRACGRAIDKGALRFGERLPNPYAEGEMTLWFHPLCAAYRRPEAVLEALADPAAQVADREALELAAHSSLRHRRLPRIDGAERSPSGQAKCRSCRNPIEKGAWRIRLKYLEEGRPSPGGFIHLDCREAYFETDRIADAVLHFSADLTDADREGLRRALAEGEG
jgi:poly(ADP-ribose) polymerase-like protein